MTSYRSKIKEKKSSNTTVKTFMIFPCLSLQPCLWPHLPVSWWLATLTHHVPSYYKAFELTVPTPSNGFSTPLPVNSDLSTIAPTLGKSFKSFLIWPIPHLLALIALSPSPFVHLTKFLFNTCWCGHSVTVSPIRLWASWRQGPGQAVSSSVPPVFTTVSGT